MNGVIWLTSAETAERIGLPLSNVLLIERKRVEDGGGVSFLMQRGRKVRVRESLARVEEAIAAARAANRRRLDFAAV